jgi:Asp-tRNA(Asn)/Glu-tRNA(Gln) amidotransferase B subunit
MLITWLIHTLMRTYNPLLKVRPVGQETFGTKVEIKNMNSFSNMQKAIEFEIERQVGLIQAGRAEEIVQVWTSMDSYGKVWGFTCINRTRMRCH